MPVGNVTGAPYLHEIVGQFCTINYATSRIACLAYNLTMYSDFPAILFFTNSSQ